MAFSKMSWESGFAAGHQMARIEQELYLTELIASLQNKLKEIDARKGNPHGHVQRTGYRTQMDSESDI